MCGGHSQVVLRLEAGQTVFYNNNLLHRAEYSMDVERITLHASVGDSRGGRKRAKNILQHGVVFMPFSYIPFFTNPFF
jgi:hypothetical protein